jgi:DsbC/DsbD-like thiol-disulfide interchange protein
MAMITAFGLVPGLAAAQSLPDTIVTAKVLTGWKTKSGGHMAAVQLTLAPGWKTYWRAPGDAGIPPQFDWAGSRNLKSVQIHWPRPKVGSTNGLRSIGYENAVVLPIEVAPTKPGQPITLNARLNLGVCEIVCIPAEVMLSATLVGKGASDGRIHDALAARPVSAKRGGVKDVVCSVRATSDGLQLTTKITMPRLGATEVVLIEAGDPRIWVSEPKSSRKGNTITTVADLVPPNAKPFALDRSAVRYTVVGAKQAVDIRGCTGG